MNESNDYKYKSKYKKVGVLPIRKVYSLTFRTLSLRQRETENKLKKTNENPENKPIR